ARAAATGRVPTGRAPAAGGRRLVGDVDRARRRVVGVAYLGLGRLVLGVLGGPLLLGLGRRVRAMPPRAARPVLAVPAGGRRAGAGRLRGTPVAGLVLAALALGRLVLAALALGRLVLGAALLGPLGRLGLPLGAIANLRRAGLAGRGRRLRVSPRALGGIRQVDADHARDGGDGRLHRPAKRIGDAHAPHDGAGGDRADRHLG